MKLKKNYSLKTMTSMKIGGKAKYFIVAKTEKDLYEAFRFAAENKIPWTIFGDGSNMVVSDQGYKGLVIQNQITKFEQTRTKVKVGGGNNLLETIQKLNSLGLKGMEKMAGIPGTVGGAVYGSAGAYGQEIKDVIVRIRFFDGERFRSITKVGAKFGYRTSIFKKHKNWIITEVELKLEKEKPKILIKTSRDIIKLREKKYKPGIKCPGSFFKNIKLSDIKSRSKRENLVKKVGEDKVRYGKIPAGILLEMVMAKGMKENTVMVAKHHGNLIYNPGHGKASDVKKLAKRLKSLVRKKFGIIIEEEVQYL